ncbi:MAG: TolC family protein [Pyrinomonadaceae bacterium]|nr:TolC family protein [Pyrinomonadaceae bacterium]
MNTAFLARLSALACLILLICSSQIRAQQSSTPTPPVVSSTPDGSTAAEPPADPVPLLQNDSTSRRTLTVDEAVRFALRQASPYTQAQLEERIAQEDLRQSRIAFLPQFTMPLTSELFSSSRVNDETLWLANATGEIDVSGRLRAAHRRNRHLLTAAEAGTLAARRAVALATVDAYYALMFATERLHVAQETLSLAVAVEQIVRERFARGEGEETDALRARTQVAARRDELSQSRAGETAANATLSSLTGGNFTTVARVSDIARDVPEVSDFSDYTETLLELRPELRQADAQREAALADARAARRERFPQMIYSVSGGYDASDVRRITRYADPAVALGVSIPLFDWGQSRSREAQARLRAESFEMQRDYTRRALRQEFYAARAVALSALARIKETRIGVESARQHFALVFALFRRNDAPITDLVDAQDALAEANLAHYQAITDYRTSRVRLETTIGR